MSQTIVGNQLKKTLRLKITIRPELNLRNYLSVSDTKRVLDLMQTFSDEVYREDIEKNVTTIVEIAYKSGYNDALEQEEPDDN